MTENEIAEARAEEFLKLVKEHSPDCDEDEYIKEAYVRGYVAGMLRGARLQRKRQQVSASESTK